MNPDPASGVDLDTLPGQELFSPQVGDPIQVSEENLTGTTVLIEVVGCAVLVFKKDFVNVV